MPDLNYSMYGPGAVLKEEELYAFGDSKDLEEPIV